VTPSARPPNISTAAFSTGSWNVSARSTGACATSPARRLSVPGLRERRRSWPEVLRSQRIVQRGKRLAIVSSSSALT
jgi:hypothetical protein